MTDPTFLGSLLRTPEALWLIKASLLLGLSWGLAALLRSASAGLRHAVWASSMIALLLVPAASSLLPGVDLAWLPGPTAEPTTPTVQAARPTSDRCSRSEPGC